MLRYADIRKVVTGTALIVRRPRSLGFPVGAKLFLLCRVRSSLGTNRAYYPRDTEAHRYRFNPGNRLPCDLPVLFKTHIYIYILLFASASQCLFCSLC
jgi:hypothetical protein